MARAVEVQSSNAPPYGFGEQDKHLANVVNVANGPCRRDKPFDPAEVPGPYDA